MRASASHERVWKGISLKFPLLALVSAPPRLHQMRFTLLCGMSVFLALVLAVINDALPVLAMPAKDGDIDAATSSPSVSNHPSGEGAGSGEVVPELAAALPGASATPSSAVSPTGMTPQSFPPTIFLEPGAIRTVAVEDLTRVAIGDPNVLDVTVVSANEVLLQAKAVGSTDLILWDQRGKMASTIQVIDRSAEIIADQLQKMLSGLNLPDVQVRREQDKVFLIGQVPLKKDMDLLEEMLGSFKGKATNLVTVPPPPPPPPKVPPQAVTLTVQLIEMTRDGTDRLGVAWEKKLTFTETTFPALSLTGGEAPSLHERIDEAFRFGALHRSALTPVLNMLVSQGKARVLAEPKLVAASGKEATVTVGVEVPVITASSVSSGTVTQNIEFKQTGVELKFQPTVVGDQAIQLLIDAKVSSIDPTQGITVSGILVPGFRNRKTKTEIVTDSGHTILIAGLIQDEEKKNFSQLPGVGNIPVLGSLFRSNEFVRGQSELVIMVTPELAEEEGASAERTFALEQALSSAEVAGAVNDPVLRYALQIQDRIAKSIRYPAREKEMKMSGRVKLRLHLFRDGTLGRAMISQPSGIEVFDAEALKAAESQSPYPPFPSDLLQQDLWLELPVLFRP